ncbi:hypothetical protein [Endozoicomonas sp. 8E]|uniref:hypothetical protein n=1 Tax=Endozoicomonas sp. 8E TaxID=3035692 RepID=UPI0029391CB1|nr:hypothetical protein [Endozoicomonas sp. 8E]WOG30151.1 hypothetical protein P6910_11010 [Endozoicomonas sp. 8E]
MKTNKGMVEVYTGVVNPDPKYQLIMHAEVICIGAEQSILMPRSKRVDSTYID